MKWLKCKAKTAEQPAGVQTTVAAEALTTGAAAPVPASPPDVETSAEGDPTPPTEATAATPATTTAATPATMAVKEGSSVPVGGAPAEPRPGVALVRLNEYRQDGALVVRAELPGWIPTRMSTSPWPTAECRLTWSEQGGVERNGYRVQELRYGRLSRSMPVGERVPTSAITAIYNNGVLKVRIPEQPAPSRRGSLSTRLDGPPARLMTRRGGGKNGRAR
jgi:HSP20 family molecular chaperone IbpA